ncbi:peroxidase family protein, partial [Pararhodobacter sp. CCB-MM2]|uniref:peroxidase family protein n=1 Tax=Pararhodobacter sp. CCB-MM2 TaxID=1786003 RepID=UPI000A92714F
MLKPFVLNQTDLEFILRQLDFIPLFDVNGDALIAWSGDSTAFDASGALLYDPEQPGAFEHDGVPLSAENVLDVLGRSFPTTTSLVGLREQSGVHNNLNAGEPTQTWGVSGATFIRLVPANFWDYVSGIDYTPLTDVNDPTPRLISRTITTGGVELAQYAAGGIMYWSQDRWASDEDYRQQIQDQWAAFNEGVEFNAAGQTEGAAVVVDHGLIAELGQTDFQNPGSAEVFLGSMNAGVAPTNSWFSLFGQFFDHGLDFVEKSSSNGKITIALTEDDPLYNAIDTTTGQRITQLKVSRAIIDNPTDLASADPTYVNHTSPYIDQNQTYGSTEAISALLREWVLDPATGTYVPGMKLFDGTTLDKSWVDGWGNVTTNTLPTLNELNEHLIATGRDPLTWDDVLNVRERDANGHVVENGVSTGQPLLLDMNPKFDTSHFSEGLQEDLAQTYIVVEHSPFGPRVSIVEPDAEGNYPEGARPILADAAGNYSTLDLMALIDFRTFSPLNNLGSDVLFDSVSAHYLAGDGRVNENFGLTAVHHVFHSEHNYQVTNLLQALAKQDAALVAEGDTSHATLHGFQVDTGIMDEAGNFVYRQEAQDETGAPVFVDVIAWDQDKVFAGVKLIVEMEYQHIAADQFAPTITADIPEYVGYNSGVDASISLEFGQVAYRFGHSLLRETVDTIDPQGSFTGAVVSYALQAAFLAPEKFAEIGPAAIALGMTHQQSGDVDEFLTPALNQGLLGLPLDLAAINIARGRDMGIPPLNELRASLGLETYDSWASFKEGMGTPESLTNFLAAYAFGPVADETGAIDLAIYDHGEALRKAEVLVRLADGQIVEESLNLENWTINQAIQFMNKAPTGDAELDRAATTVDAIDAWMGGLAEAHVIGGILGEVFNVLFVDQIVRLKDGDRMYYLYRLVNQNFGDEIANEQFKDIVERNTGLTGLNGSIFAYADEYHDFLQESGRLSDAELQSVLEANPDVGILTRDGSEAANGSVLTLSNAQAASLSRTNVAINGLKVSFDNLDVITKTFVLAQRAELDPSIVTREGTPVTGAGSHEVIRGTNNDDVVYLGAGDDTGYLEDGNDIAFGGLGIDRIYGGNGDDILVGGDGGDLLDGGAGDDVIYGGNSGTAAAGLNQVIGGAGNDVIYAGQGIDKISGSGGDDVIFGEGDTDAFTHGGDGNDYIDGGQSGDLLYGDNGDDVLVGGDDQDFLQGGLGDDIIRPGNASQALAGFGPDEVIGGDGLVDTGFDIIDFSDYLAGAQPIVADFNTQANPQRAIDLTTAFPAWFQMEGVIGSQNGDVFIGDANGNWMFGGRGDDTMTGGEGNDVMIGDSIRLDQLIGRYSGEYTAYDEIAEASFRTNGTLQADGLLGREDLGTEAFELHFVEMLKSRMFKDYVLGDSLDRTEDGMDTVLYGGTRDDYDIRVIAAPNMEGTVVLVTGLNDFSADGTDLIFGIETLRFGDGTELSLLNEAPVVYLEGLTQGLLSDAFGADYTSGRLSLANGEEAAWTQPWVEADDDQGGAPDAGAIQISNNALRFEGGNAGNATPSIARSLEQLEGAQSATLRFDFDRASGRRLEADDTLQILLVRGSGEVVDVATLNAETPPGPLSFLLSGPFDAETELHIVKNSLSGDREFMQIDNVEIAFSLPLPEPSEDISLYYLEGVDALSIGAAARLSDDGGELSAARITLINAEANDRLIVDDLPEGLVGVIDTSASGQISVEITGVGSLNAYEVALAAIRFANDSDAPVAGTRAIQVQVNDGLVWGEVSTARIEVVPVNDAPDVGTDSVVLGGQGTFLLRLEDLLVNDVDPDGVPVITDVTGSRSIGVSLLDNGISLEASGRGSFAYDVSDGELAAQGNVDVRIVRFGQLSGTNAADIILADPNSNNPRDINGGEGNDTIYGSGADETILWSVGGGSDVVHGGGGIDTLDLTGSSQADETFTIYAVKDADLVDNSQSRDALALELGLAPDALSDLLGGGAEIIITRLTNGVASIVTKADEIEEIIVNLPGRRSTTTVNVTENNGDQTLTGFESTRDSVVIVGDFDSTSLEYSTITIKGDVGDETVDITALSSAHRIVFEGNGGSDALIGEARPQDVVMIQTSDPVLVPEESVMDGSLAAPSADAAEEDEVLSVPSVDAAEEDEVLSAPSADAAEEDEVLSVPSADAVEEDEVLSAPSADAAEEDEVLSAPSADAVEEDEVLSVPSVDAAEEDEVLSVPSVDAAEEDEVLSAPSVEAPAEDEVLSDPTVPPVVDTPIEEELVSMPSVVSLGGAGSDSLAGSEHDDVLRGEGGNDVLRGGGGADLLLGGDGQDVLY